jgi:hypothetical protein
VSHPVVLSEPLEAQAAEVARRQGISVDEFVQRAVEEHLKRLAKRAADPFFSDTAVFVDDGPTDMALNHDHYLYDVDPHGERS